MWIRRSCLLLVVVVGPVGVCVLGAFAVLRIVRFALLRHPWRSYSVFVRLILVLISLAGMVSHGPVLLVSGKLVSSFSAVLAAPIPVVFVDCACRRMIVVGSLVIYRSVGLDSQLETVCWRRLPRHVVAC